MRIEAAHRNDNALAKAERLRPFATQVAGGNARRQRAIVESIAKIGELRIEPRQEFLRRQSSPLVGIHRLVPGRADAADDVLRIVDAGKYSRDEIGELDPTCGGVEHLWRHLQALPDLRPPPLG